MPEQAVWPHSGHYRPTEENFEELVSFLTDSNVDLTDVKVRALLCFLTLSSPSVPPAKITLSLMLFLSLQYNPEKSN